MAGVIATGSLLVSDKPLIRPSRSKFQVFLHLNKVNRVTLNFVECYNRDVKFDLSVRYQLRENVKTFKVSDKLLSNSYHLPSDAQEPADNLHWDDSDIGVLQDSSNDNKH